MAKEIGRLNSFGIGLEATAGTSAPIDYWVPVEEGNLKPVVETIKDASGIGVIDEFSDSHATKQMSEFTGKGIVRSKSIGTLLTMALGTSGTPTLIETGVYSHAFSRLNNNSHPSATIIRDNATQEETSPYHMLDTLSLAFEVGSQAKFDVKTVGKAIANATGNSPSFVTLDEPFLVSKMTVRFATTQAGLASATPVPVQSLNFEIAKNLTQIFSSSGVAETEVLNFASQHNQQFNVSGDMEITYNDDVYKTLFSNQTKTAIQVQITGKTLVGATKFNQLTFEFMSCNLEDWDRSTGNNDIMSQTFGFSALYSISDTKTMSALLQNSISTQYIG